jgi:Flp pilus assembly protein TadB
VSTWLGLVAAVSSGVAAACLLPPSRGDLAGVRHGRPALPGHSRQRGKPDAFDAGPSRSATPAVHSRAGIGFRAASAVATGLGVMVFVGGWPGLALGPIGTVVVWRVAGRIEPASARRRREQLARALPHAVDLMASSLSVGTSPSTAVALVASAVDPPMRDELALVASRLALGADPVRVWSELTGHPQLGALGRCLVRATDSGASVADAMHRLAEDLRRTARADVESRARTVGVKAAAPLGLCLLPAFILTGIVPLVAGSVAVLLLGR